MNRIFAYLLCASSAVSANSIQQAAQSNGVTVNDCTENHLVILNPQAICLGRFKLMILVGGFARITDTFEVVVQDESLEITLIARPDNPMMHDKIYFTSQEVRFASLADRPSFADQIFGAFIYGTEGSPLAYLFTPEQLADLIAIQVTQPFNDLVTLEYPVGSDIFNTLPSDEFPGQIRFVLEPVDLMDFGDAPSAYPTLLVDDGARHVINDSVSMTPPFGSSPDGEGDGFPAPDAMGDDLNDFDDEDGVTLPMGGVFLIDTTQTISIYSIGGNPFLNAWIDFNRDGDWNDPGEQIATDRPMPDFLNHIDVVIPASTSPGETFMRFRLSTMPGLAPSGPAPDGEVEDYRVLLANETLDFGDAPDSYMTLRASGGPFHVVDGDFRLGLLTDIELDGQPDVLSFGDDDDNQDDEDGLVFNFDVIPGTTFTITAENLGNSGFLSLWIDFNGNGDFLDPGELIAGNEPLPGLDLTTFSIDVPVSAQLGTTHLRARLSSAPLSPVSPSGFGGIGEVEDHPIRFVSGFDFGDAPAPYPTTLDEGGAVHITREGFYLGTTIDSEINGQPDPNALGDDNAGASVDDEDGVEFPRSLTHGDFLESGVSGNEVFVRASQNGGTLHVFLDVNGDGDFDDQFEKQVDNLPLTAGLNSIAIGFVDEVPSLFPLDTYIRFRFALGNQFLDAGNADDDVLVFGEVEDYKVRLISGLLTNGFESEPSEPDRASQMNTAGKPDTN